VVYGKISSKKHKTWDNDGLLEVTGKDAVLKVRRKSLMFLINLAINVTLDVTR
jgi:hypothetical protein